MAKARIRNAAPGLVVHYYGSKGGLRRALDRL